LSENSIDYDIFIHTYKIHGPYNNQWSKECTQIYINEDVQNILNPDFFIHDDQNNIVNNINFNEYYTKLGNWTGMNQELTKYLIRNMCLALYSKKMITNLFENHIKNYDYAIIIRPDLVIKTKIDVNWFSELTNNNIIIPACDSYSGCNDRLCIGKVNTILYYGTLFDQLKEYSTKQSIISEKYLLDMLKRKNMNIIHKDIRYDTLRI